MKSSLSERNDQGLTISLSRDSPLTSKNRLALDRLKSISALSAPTAVKGLTLTLILYGEYHSRFAQTEHTRGYRYYSPRVERVGSDFANCACVICATSSRDDCVSSEGRYF